MSDFSGFGGTVWVYISDIQDEWFKIIGSVYIPEETIFLDL